ncbi:hypothetical protein KBW71_01120 [Hydrogenophaga aromaticivorans]|uniref:hypothetical protein n=1 Tax=Hydrogenophaga aromaticivorans TaxID=2610898 RepID=UPI000CAD093C|nr:hypothetical protein [Hydrogenophaga aromaticivorans]MBQ0917031.1 hypothetical protein [Hydrogenophaga aromaticivorans]PKO59077.1 MAG: hypothetical protein CVU24_16035 [Betaproteobacteria bacterium HGW-Betaproteobacteria-18]
MSDPSKEHLLEYSRLTNVKSFDAKADFTLVPELKEMMSRGEAFRDECRRRGVGFLPEQVMRPVYEKKGLVYGPRLKTRPIDFYLNPFFAKDACDRA